MSQEIKFRCWEPIEKRFLSWEEVQENTIQDVFRLFDCQQFTGLLDSKGNEIYEGDVLRYSRYVDHGQWGETVDGGTAQVVWLEERAGFYPFYMWSSYNDQLKSCEVIGNIYENPKPLKTGPC